MSTAASEWSDTATATTNAPAPVPTATAAEATSAPATTNHDVWDAWPVRAEIFGEASVTGRRVAADPMGLTDDGHAWGVRVDTAVNGFDQHDRAKVDDWINIHAGSVTPELYEARIVAAWESRYPPLEDDQIGRDLEPAPAKQSAADLAPVFAIQCDPCELDFVRVTKRGEADYLADTHNDLHHGGRVEAIAYDTVNPDEVDEALGYIDLGAVDDDFDDDAWD